MVIKKVATNAVLTFLSPVVVLAMLVQESWRRGKKAISRPKVCPIAVSETNQRERRQY
jgi:hypothetical protein